MEQLLEQIGTIYIPLEWDGDQGSAAISYTLEAGGCAVECSIHVWASMKYSPATYLQPDEYEVLDTIISVEDLTLWEGENQIKAKTNAFGSNYEDLIKQKIIRNVKAL